MVDPNISFRYYCLAGRFTESEREFKKYLKKELNFYQRLHKIAIENSTYGSKSQKIRSTHSRLEDINLY